MTTAIEMKTISPQQLREWQNSKKDFQLVDIREEHEIAENTIGGKHIPMDEVIARVSELRKDVPVVIHCRSGRRSDAVVYALESKFELPNLYTLKGGIAAWLESAG